MWSDTQRFHPTSISEETIFPDPMNYTNLDHFLHDVRLAVNQERKYRKLHHLHTDEDRYTHNLERLYLQSEEIFTSPDFQFDVI